MSGVLTPQVAALLISPAPGWSARNGLPALVTYSFDNNGQTPFAALPAGTWAPFGGSQKDGIRQALAAWDSVSGLSFVEVPGSLSQLDVDIRFHLQEAFYPGDGMAGFPDTGGDVWFSLARLQGDSFAPGSYGFFVALHEIGHAIGLKHPFEGTPRLSAAEDSAANTVMSYNGFASSLGPYDVAAAQYIYGTDAEDAGRTVRRAWDDAASLIRHVGSASSEMLESTAFRDDMLAGGGDDRLEGGGGADTLAGEAGDDTLDGGTGGDLLLGGEGLDIATYAAAANRVAVSLAVARDNSWDAAGDTLIGIEAVIGSAYGDTLTGSSGDDALEGGPGADRLDGGAGYDVASYAFAAAAVAASLLTGTGSAGDAAGDTLIGIESLRGSPFADTLTGSDDHNILEGGPGADRLDGRGGNDWLSYEHAGGGIAVNLAASNGWAGDATGDSMTGIENLRGSAFTDYLYGDAGANILRGDAGGDVLYGAGNSDTIYYSTSPAAVRVDLSTNSASGGDAEGDTLVSVENVFATPFDDVLIGDSASNTLVGWLGRDVLTGNGGNDIFRWSATNESGTAAGTRDVVTDFWRVHGDLLDLSGIDANATLAGDQAFAWIGWAGFSAPGQLRYFFDGLGNTVFEVNVDANLAADMAVQLTGTLFLASTDFIL